MMVARDRTASKIPEFASREEEAVFWDEHDATEFAEEWEPVELEIAQPLGHILSIRLESADFRRLSAIARTSETNVIRLAERWVLEALDRAEAGAAVEEE